MNINLGNAHWTCFQVTLEIGNFTFARCFSAALLTPQIMNEKYVPIAAMMKKPLGSLW